MALAGQVGTGWMITLLAMAASLLLSAAPALAAPVDVYFFWREGCPHCEKEKVFLQKLQAADAAVRVHEFEILRSKANRALLIQVGRTLNADITSVPVTVIGDRIFIGYLNDAVTGQQLRDRVQVCATAVCPDSVNKLLQETTPGKPGKAETDAPSSLPASLQLPLLGAISTKDLSLPLITIILAAVDGFNPCAMWTLVFLLGLLIGMTDKKRMWTLGTAFIVASAGVYFLFMAAWLNVLLFLGMIVWVRLAIGGVALAGGVYYLRQYLSRKDDVCEVTAPAARRKIFERLKALAQAKQLYLALGGIVVLAFAVNLVEVVCSAGIPAVFTQILALSDLAVWQYYAYLLLYIFVFMLDDLIVFFTALTTLQVTGLTNKYSRYSHLLGGTILCALGVLLILRPQWLSFA